MREVAALVYANRREMSIACPFCSRFVEPIPLRRFAAGPSIWTHHFSMNADDPCRGDVPSSFIVAVSFPGLRIERWLIAKDGAGRV